MVIHPLPSRDIQVGHPDNLDKVGPRPPAMNGLMATPQVKPIDLRPFTTGEKHP